jgi:hypothetical protein
VLLAYLEGLRLRAGEIDLPLPMRRRGRGGVVMVVVVVPASFLSLLLLLLLLLLLAALERLAGRLWPGACFVLWGEGRVVCVCVFFHRRLAGPRLVPNPFPPTAAKLSLPHMEQKAGGREGNTHR